eukprot:6193723-Pleurochrysis_carterae.AAC.3
MMVATRSTMVGATLVRYLCPDSEAARLSRGAHLDRSTPQQPYMNFCDCLLQHKPKGASQDVSLRQNVAVFASYGTITE